LLTKDNFQTSKAWANIAVRQVLGLLWSFQNAMS